MKSPNILVPLDGSDFSQKVLSHLEKLYGPRDCQLTLLRVAEPPKGLLEAIPVPIKTGDFINTPLPQPEPHYRIYPSQVEDSLVARYHAELSKASQELQAAGYEVGLEVRFGDPAQEILHFVETEAIDLVAMATHGRSGLSRLLMGSVAMALVRHLAIPILLVRPVAAIENRNQSIKDEP